MRIFGKSPVGGNSSNAGPQKDSKLYRTINTVSIVGLFAAVVLGVLSIMGIIKFNRYIVGVILTIGALCLGCVLMLPWIRRLEHKELKIVSLVFIALDALVPILWTICIWIVIGVTSGGTMSVGLIKFIQAVLIISVQFAVASYIATGITKYKKTMIVFQAIAYTCYMYVDFIITYFLCCLNFGGKEIFVDKIGLLSSIWIWAIFAIAAIFTGISNGIMYRSDIRRIRDTMDDMHLQKPQNTDAQAEPVATPAESAEEQLNKLKSLLDKNLITEEEYNKKREEIINKL